jgi:hypothetical protein
MRSAASWPVCGRSPDERHVWVAEGHALRAPTVDGAAALPFGIAFEQASITFWDSIAEHPRRS